jgi:hypothetical protein
MLWAGCLFSGETASRQIGPGSFHYHFVDQTIPLSIHILEFDLRDPNLEIITQKANYQLAAREKTSVMAEQLETEGKNVIAAINADFFHKNGTPVGIQIADGVILKNPFIRSVFGLLENNRPFIEMLSFRGMLFTEKGSIAIDGINGNRGENDLILFNNYIGVSSNTNDWGVEVAARYVSQPCVNDTSYLVVISKDNSGEKKGDKEIPGYGIILSGHGNKGEFLATGFDVGDTLKILLELPPVEEKIIEAVSGAPRIIEKGRVKIDVRKEKLPQSFSTTQHPRTAIGYNRNKTKLMFFVVDGRQAEHSIGMSLRELAKFMLDWDVYEAVNLDGGGSSTMYVRGEIVNKPSDATGERSVTNALVVLCKNKSDEVKYISIQPKQVQVSQNSSYHFDTKLFDKYFNPLENKKVNWFCDHRLGKIDETGRFSAANNSAAGYIVIEADGKKDSSYVIIK